MEPVQGSYLNRRYISGLETEMPVTPLTLANVLYTEKLCFMQC